MIKFGLTKKEEKLYSRACVLLGKAEETQRKFYDSIYNRFEKAGYDAEAVLDTIISSDTYVFSESGCCGEIEYEGFDNMWEWLKNLFKEKGKKLNGEKR